MRTSEICPDAHDPQFADSDSDNQTKPSSTIDHRPSTIDTTRTPTPGIPPYHKQVD